KRAAIIMLSTLSGSSRDQAFYDLIDEALKIRLKEAHERYYNSLDPKCEIWVDDLSIFERWLSKVLPEEARFVGMTQPHPESQKVLQSLFADECTTTGRKVLGYVSRSVNRGSIQG